MKRKITSTELLALLSVKFFLNVEKYKHLTIRELKSLMVRAMLKHNDVILKIYESIADDYNVDIARFRKHDFISRLNELNFMLASALEEFQNYMLLHYDTDINDLVDINILMYRFDSFIRCGLYFNTN